MIDDFCKFFADIEENPDAIVKGLTVRDYYLLRAHVDTCDTCFNRTERVLQSRPPEDDEPPIKIGFN